MTSKFGDKIDLDLLRRVADKALHWPYKAWGFGEGIALRGLISASQVTGRSDYIKFVRELLSTYARKEVGLSNEEHIAPGTELLLVYEMYEQPEFLTAAKKLAKLNATFPTNRFGARMHRPDLSGWRKQIWVDSLDVDAPFLVRLGRLTGEQSYIEQGLAEILGYARALQIEGADERAGFFWHGYEEDCGNNGQLWARGNGWALMGLVETLSLLPEDCEDRSELLERLQSLCLAMERYQESDGLWHTVVTHPDTYRESTLAVMASFALRSAFSRSLLDKDRFGEMERKARAAAKDCISDEGTLELVSDATPVAEFEMYATRPFGVYPWGQGPLLLMLTQEFL